MTQNRETIWLFCSLFIVCDGIIFSISYNFLILWFAGFGVYMTGLYWIHWSIIVKQYYIFDSKMVSWSLAQRWDCTLAFTALIIMLSAHVDIFLVYQQVKAQTSSFLKIRRRHWVVALVMADRGVSSAPFWRVGYLIDKFYRCHRINGTWITYAT